MSEDLPVWEGIETYLLHCHQTNTSSEDLPVWEGIETMKLGRVSNNVLVWGPTCLRRYWDARCASKVNGRTVWGPTCLRRYWDPSGWKNWWKFLSEDLPVWEGIETFLRVVISWCICVWGPTCLRRYWDYISRRPGVLSHVWGPTCLRRYWDPQLPRV